MYGYQSSENATFPEDIDDLTVMNFYLKEYHNKGFLKEGVQISNPFLQKKQETPSFNVFKLRTGKWKYHDFATEDNGDVLDLVKELFKLNYKDAKSKIQKDMNKIIEYASTIKKTNPTQNDIFNNKQKTNMNNGNSTGAYKVTARDFNVADFNFWHKKYQINRETLTKYKVIPISSFSRGDKLITPSGISYAYDLETGFKIYQPTNKEYKFQYIGQKEEKFIFGYKQLPETGDIVFIAAGEKDVLTLAVRTFFAICLNSETASLPDWLYEDLGKRFKKIVVIYDNDETGIKQSQKLCSEHSLERIILPPMEGGKDLSDFVSSGNSIETLINLNYPKIFNRSYSISSFSKLALMGMSLPPIRRIWGCFVLESSLILFPSERGIGKTFLMLELAIMVAHEADSFCGEEIQLHGNTLYINLELSEILVSKRLTDLLKMAPLKSNKYEAHCMTITGNLESNFSNVKEVISELKPVLIIIDNLRAASSHIDNEKNKAVTGFIQKLKALIAEYNCAIIIVHHLKKGTQNQRLNSDMQSGAGALTDLVDGDFFLGRSTQNKNYRLLKRLKSRSCEEQEDATLLLMNPDTLWFELKEESVNESDHIVIEDKDKGIAKQTEEMKSLHAQGKTLEEIATQFDVNKSTVSRRLKKVIK